MAPVQKSRRVHDTGRWLEIRARLHPSTQSGPASSPVQSVTLSSKYLDAWCRVKSLLAVVGGTSNTRG